MPVISDGGKTYSFQLRSNIRYSNGELVRARDFRAALERELKAGAGFALTNAHLLGANRCSKSACDLGRGIVTDNAAGTIVFHLSAPDPDFPFELALAWAMPCHPPRRKSTSGHTRCLRLART
jgi:peptide/nickel transport system substrate-binding protein